MFPEVDFMAIQHRKVLDNLRSDKSARLSDRDMSGLLSPDDYAAYKAAAQSASEEIQKYEGRLGITSDEAWAFWTGCQSFYRDCYKVWRMPESNKNLREAKRSFEHLVRHEHMPKLKELWGALPSHERRLFYTANIYEAMCANAIPTVAIPLKDREKRDRAIITAQLRAKRSGVPLPEPIALDWDFLMPRKALHVLPDVTEGPWRAQVAALEAALGAAEPSTSAPMLDEVPPVENPDRFLTWGGPIGGRAAATSEPSAEWPVIWDGDPAEFLATLREQGIQVDAQPIGNGRYGLSLTPDRR